MSWDAMHAAWPMRMVANLRATKKWAACPAPGDESSVDDLNNHPIAEVLSSMTRMHGCGTVESMHLSQIFTTMAVNSRRLLILGWSRRG